MSEASFETRNETLFRDILEAMKNGFAALEKRMDVFGRRVGGLEGAVATLQEGQDALRVQVQDVRQRVGNLENRTEDVYESVRVLSSAFDKDAVKVLDHEKRITRLERRFT